MSTKHRKTKTPSDADLKGNPLIGGSKGVTRAHATPDELDASRGANTIEGDVGNDTNPHGGIDKSAARRGGIGQPKRRSEKLRMATRIKRAGASTMARGGKHIGRGSHGKGAGTGAMTDARIEEIENNKVLSNRDKGQHTRERGQDSKWVETEELKDHVANRGGG